MYLHNTGWVVSIHNSGIQDLAFYSLYTSSMYWVITTFSSVGFGDILGNTQLENMFSIMVEMVGIVIFGYMINSF